MNKILLTKLIFVSFFLLANISHAQVRSGTGILKDNTVNTYQKEKQKEKLKRMPKMVFSDREENCAYEEPYSSKVKSKIALAKPMYVINENNYYYEVVEANEKLLGKPKVLFAFMKSKRFHFANSKEIKYLGWIKKSNVIEYNCAEQNQENLKYVKYLVASNKPKALYTNDNTIIKNEIVLRSDPSLLVNSKNKISRNDFVYVFKTNKSSNAAFVSNFDNLSPIDTTNQKKGWISLDYITPLEDNIIVKLNGNDSLQFVSKNFSVEGRELYKNMFFINERQSDSSVDYNKKNKVVLPINVWNHENNKITNLKGDAISMEIITQIEKQQKVINLFYVFDNDVNNREVLSKLLGSIQNIKISISKEQFTSYKFTFSFIAKNRKSYFLIKSDSFSKWFDMLEKSIKNPEKIDQKNIMSAKISTVNDFLSNEESFENNFFIVAGANNTISSILPNDKKRLVGNNAKIIFIVLENKNTAEIQDFILQSKSYLNEVSNNNKEFIKKYYVDQKQLIENDEFVFSDEYDNAYVFDAPLRSNFNGGIVFPKLNSEINPKSINKAIDTILSKMIRTNDLHLKSLQLYRNEFSFLRSQPSDKLNELLKNVATDDSTSTEMPKHYKNEILVVSVEDSLKKSLETKLYLLMNGEEINTLIENYRDLVSQDYTEENVDKDGVLNFQRKAKIFLNNRKKATKVKVSNTLATLFHNKTGVFVNSSKLHKIKIKDIKKMKKNPSEFRDLFLELNAKLEELEKRQRNNSFEIFNEDATVKYYFVSKQLLL